ncbi:MAG: hypothetical protein ACK6DX_06305, partial [Acidobacteriota bacterium]
QFTQLMQGISFKEETLVWARQALGPSHRAERQFHADAISTLQGEHRRLLNHSIQYGWDAKLSHPSVRLWDL